MSFNFGGSAAPKPAFGFGAANTSFGAPAAAPAPSFGFGATAASTAAPAFGFGGAPTATTAGSIKIDSRGGLITFQNSSLLDRVMKNVLKAKWFS